jgi:hypothetical protein
MWILFLEMGLALGVIIFIMWWTMSARVDHHAQNESEENAKDD